VRIVVVVAVEEGDFADTLCSRLDAAVFAEGCLLCEVVAEAG
jgi:hypothetical protein